MGQAATMIQTTRSAYARNILRNAHMIASEGAAMLEHWDTQRAHFEETRAIIAERDADTAFVAYVKGRANLHRARCLSQRLAAQVANELRAEMIATVLAA